MHTLSDITDAPIVISPPKAAPQNLSFPFITGAVNVGVPIIDKAIADAVIAAGVVTAPTPPSIFLKIIENFFKNYYVSLKIQFRKNGRKLLQYNPSSSLFLLLPCLQCLQHCKIAF